MILIAIGVVISPKPTEQRSAETEGEKFARLAIEAKARGEKERSEKAAESERIKRDAERNARTEKFKQWALANTAVTDIAINGKSMFVTLTNDKYTNRDNVRVIAEKIAMAYANQVGVDYAVCHVFYGREEYTKGTYSR